MTSRQKDGDVESCLQVLRRPHEFKIRALEDIRALFPEDWNPFFAGNQPQAVLLSWPFALCLAQSPTGLLGFWAQIVVLLPYSAALLSMKDLPTAH